MRLRVYGDDYKMPFSKEKRVGRILIDRNGKVINKVFPLLLTTGNGSCITSIKVTYEPVKPIDLLRTRSLSTFLQPSELLFIMVRSRLLFLKES